MFHVLVFLSKLVPILLVNKLDFSGKSMIVPVQASREVVLQPVPSSELALGSMHLPAAAVSLGTAMQPATHLPSPPDPQTNRVTRVEASVHGLIQCSGSPSTHENGRGRALQ